MAATIGVSVTVGSIGPSAIPTIGYSNGFFVVQTPWGIDGVPQMCTSLTDYVRKYGGLNKLVTLAADGSADTWGIETADAAVQSFYAVKGFFDEKGGNPNAVCFISRVVKVGTAGVLTLNDGAAHNTLFTSKWKGAGGNTTTVQVTTPSPEKGSNYARVTVANTQANIVEVWQISGYADATSASAKSELITITLPAAQAFPGALPITSTAKKLGNSAVGTTDTYAAIASDMIGTTDASNNKTGLAAFSDFRLGLGLVCIPGFLASSIASGMKTHCELYYRLGILGSSASLTTNTVRADLGTTASSYLAYYAPRLKVLDQNSDTGGTLLIDPCGHVGGLFARMDAKYQGPHKSAAGIDNALSSVYDVERTSSGLELYDDAASNVLADTTSTSGPINTIRIKRGPTVWGLRTLASDLRYRQANQARTVGVVYWTCYLIGEPLTFEPIDPDGVLFSKLYSTLYGFLYNLRKAGALYGTYPGSSPNPKDAFGVVCDTGNNNDLTVGAGELHADVAIAPTPNAEQVKFNLLVSQPGFVSARSVAGV